jgi:hypothetical protein
VDAFHGISGDLVLEGRQVTRLLSTTAVFLALASPAYATCSEAWPPDMKTRPDYTCVPLTDRLLVSLQGATKEQVTKAMKANGRLVDDTVLHFVSVADHFSGDMNFKIEGDRVILIFGMVDGEKGKNMSFTWNPAYQGGYACSDLPGSHYKGCDR